MDDVKERPPDIQTCKICEKKPVRTSFLPCGHLVGCDKCTSNLQKCPKCQTKVNWNKRQFLEDDSSSLQVASHATECYQSREDRIKKIESDLDPGEQIRQTLGLKDDPLMCFCCEVATAMIYLQDIQIVLRDMKPGDILQYIEEDGRHIYRLTDFGAAKESDEEQFTSLYGTEEYLHPDMYKRARLRDTDRSLVTSDIDLWSLGVSIYHVTAGQLPIKSFGGRRITNKMCIYKFTDFSGAKEKEIGKDELMVMISATEGYLFKMVSMMERTIHLEIKVEDIDCHERDVRALPTLLTQVHSQLAQVERKAGTLGSTAAATRSEQKKAELTRSLDLHDTEFDLLDVRMAELDQRFQIFDSTNLSSSLPWKVKDFTRRKEGAVLLMTPSLYSQPFYTRRHGYNINPQTVPQNLEANTLRRTWLKILDQTSGRMAEAGFFYTGIDTSSPKHPHYAVRSVRISSFVDWPESNHQDPAVLAEAGFSFAGIGDCVRCFYCGAGLRHWSVEDDPWIEHARWAQTCANLRQNKGDEFISLVHMAINILRDKEPSEPGSQPNEEITRGLMTDAAQSVVEMGYDTRIIRRAIDSILRDTGRAGVTSQRIMEKVLELEEEQQNVADKPTPTPPPTHEMAQLAINKHNIYLGDSGNPSTEEATPQVPGTGSQTGAVSAGTEATSNGDDQTGKGTKEILEAERQVISRVPTEGKVQISVQRYCDYVIVDTEIDCEKEDYVKDQTWQTNVNTAFIMLFILLCLGAIHTSCDVLSYILSLSGIVWNALLMCFEQTDLFQADRLFHLDNATKTTVQEWSSCTKKDMMVIQDVMSQWGYGVLFYLMLGNLNLLKPNKTAKHISDKLGQLIQGKCVFKDELSKETLQDLFGLRQIPTVPILSYPFQYSKISNHSRNESMKKEWNRISSFGQNYTSRAYALSLAKHGFYYDSRSHQVRCFCCGVNIEDNGQTEVEIAQLHQAKAPRCQHVARNDAASGNIPIDTAPAQNCSCTPVAGASGTSSQPSHRELLEEPMRRDVYGQDFQVPEHPRYQSYENRLMSFRTWRHQIEPSPRCLAEAGFFYTGHGDKVVCFTCDIGCHEWNDGENAWMEHAVANIDCPFLKLLKDSVFFERARKEISERQQERSRTNLRSRITEPVQEVDIMSTYTARVLSEVCTDSSLIAKAVQYVWRVKGSITDDPHLAMNWLLDEKEKQELSSNSDNHVQSHTVSVTAVTSRWAQSRQLDTVATMTASITTSSISMTSTTTASGRDATAVKQCQQTRAARHSLQAVERVTAANLTDRNHTRSLPIYSMTGQQGSNDHDRRMTEVAQRLMALGYTLAAVIKEMKWMQLMTDISVQDIVQMAVISIKGKQTQCHPSEDHDRRMTEVAQRLMALGYTLAAVNEEMKWMQLMTDISVQDIVQMAVISIKGKQTQCHPSEGGELLERSNFLTPSLISPTSHIDTQGLPTPFSDDETLPDDTFSQEMIEQQGISNEVSGAQAMADEQLMSTAQGASLVHSMADIHEMSHVEVPPVDQNMLMDEVDDNVTLRTDEAAGGQALISEDQTGKADEDPIAATRSNGSCNGQLVATEGATGGHINGQTDTPAVKKKRSKRSSSKRNRQLKQVQNASADQQDTKVQDARFSEEQSQMIGNLMMQVAGVKNSYNRTLISLKEENEKLKEVTKCKVCLERDVSIVFLPCGHQVTCEPCSMRVQSCPICRQPILRKQKTYM